MIRHLRRRFRERMFPGPWEAAFFLLLGLYCIVVLRRTASLPIHLWDETRSVMNAYEMMRNGDWIAPTFMGDLDLFCLKPPLLKWLLALLFKAFGFSEWAARLPGVAFGAGTAVLVFGFLRRLGVHPLFGAVAGMALLTSTGFYGDHAMTSADVDVPVCFFNTLSFIAAHQVFLDGRPRWYMALGLSLGLGFLTKSVVGLMPAACVPIGLVFGRDWKSVRTPYLAACAALWILVAVPWFTARHLLYPDNYLGRLIGYEVIARATTILDEHEGNFWFYGRWAMLHLGAWAYAGAAILATALVVWARERPADRPARLLRRSAAYAFTTVFLYYVAFSCARTKIGWYILQVYPIFFMLVGMGLERLGRILPRRWLAIACAALLGLNLLHLRAYDSRRWTRVPMLDYLLFPMKRLIWHRHILVQGDVPQNALVTARIYSDLQDEHFREPVPLERMLERAPDSEFLFTDQAPRYAGHPRLQLLALVTRDGRAAGPGALRILPP